MRTYSERFKKELVKKVLTPGIQKREVCKKLNLYEKTVSKWVREYRHEVEKEAENQVLDAIQPEEEEEVDIDKLLAEYDRKAMSAEEEKQEQSIDRILDKGKHPSEYNRQEKYVMVD
jgi:transposase-like protein